MKLDKDDSFRKVVNDKFNVLKKYCADNFINNEKCSEELPPGINAHIGGQSLKRWTTPLLFKTQSVARVLYQIYYDVYLPPKRQVNHKCGNAMCLNITHLYIGNHRQNMRDKIRHGTTNLGKKWKVAQNKIHYKKLSAEKNKEIREVYGWGNVSQRELASHFGVSQCQINKIIKNEPIKKSFSELLLQE